MSDTGGGHRSAAEAIIAATAQIEAETTVELLDFFSSCSPFPLNQADKFYTTVVKYAAPLWGTGFHLTNGRRRASVLESLISLAARRCAEAKLQVFQPDVLVCVHPLATRLAADVRRNVDGTLPFATVVTDLIAAHASWFARDVDLLTVPSKVVQAKALAAGILPEKIKLTGQPVHPRFTEINADSRATRESLGLVPDRFTVLLIGGGEGMGRVAEMAQAVDAAGLCLQQIIICGRNKALRQRLARQGWRVPTRIFGFVHNMPTLMHAADIVVTKAGPSTICEALVVGRPILLTGYIPGQERGNVDFVVEGGAGWLTEAPQALVAALQRLFRSEGGIRERMTANARQLAQPSAAQDIAHLLFDLGNR